MSRRPKRYLTFVTARELYERAQQADLPRQHQLVNLTGPGRLAKLVASEQREPGDGQTEPWRLLTLEIRLMRRGAMVNRVQVGVLDSDLPWLRERMRNGPQVDGHDPDLDG